MIALNNFFLIIFGLLNKIKSLEVSKILNPFDEKNASEPWVEFLNNYYDNINNPIAVLLLQVVTIVIVARIFTFICRQIGQPGVVGEICAGIILGPSFIGTYCPDFSLFMFSKQSLGNLQLISQLGLIFFMFIVGMELDFKLIKTKVKAAFIISQASIIVPFAFGMLLAYYMYLSFAPNNIPFLSFALFMGVSMSITAFPVLARIIQEKGISKTKLGTMIITCAAIDDITAWFILAAIIAIVKSGSFISSLYVVALTFFYVFIMLKVIQPALTRLGSVYFNKKDARKFIVAIIFIILFLSSYLTEVIGIHALFGAFMAGIIMPSEKNFRNLFLEKIQDLTSIILLPLFFVLTGLRTQVGLLQELQLWQLCIVIIAVATVGKFLSSAIAAKLVGHNLKDSLTIGACMNTRGLVELVVLNIGYDLGILTPTVFTMMVIMAIVTTFMTGPIIDIIFKLFPNKELVPRNEGAKSLPWPLNNPS